MDKFLEINGAYKNFGNIIVLKNVSISLEKNEVLGILGPSGCGKTTLLRAIAGLEHLDKGIIKLNDKIITDNKNFISPEKRKVGFVFQDLALWPHMKVKEHIQFVLDTQKNKESFDKYLKMVELSNQKNKYPHQLSGGQKQRVALARTLAQKCELLLLDEPMSNLDAFLKDDFKKQLIKLKKKLNLPIIYVTHNISELTKLVDKIAIMDSGKIIQVNTLSKLKDNPKNNIVKKLVSR